MEDQVATSCKASKLGAHANSSLSNGLTCNLQGVWLWNLAKVIEDNISFPILKESLNQTSI